MYSLVFINHLILISWNPAALHPYFKLDYIEMQWGGAEQQRKEKAAGNRFAKNWRDEARKVLEETVRSSVIFLSPSTTAGTINYCLIQVEEYWKSRPSTASERGSHQTSPDPEAGAHENADESEFDHYRRGLLERSEPSASEEGWEPELRRYLKTLFKEAAKDMDLVEWWSVRET